ncbi:MAG: sterol desaturase family protein [Aquincola sp.]|uniref:sterol desaturase family protein n=1 Tax=uncultured Aquincola sp. TaxID=886556 RepID=UPI0032B2A29D|nr:sterol desaturase family protein [Aquincola sp.]
MAEMLRAAAWLLLLLVFGLAERRWPVRRQPLLRPGWQVDLGYFVLSSFAPRLLLALPLSALAALLHQAVPAAYYQAAAELPLGLRLLLALVVSDLGAYWGHRWAHRWAWWWRLHAVHHSAEQMDWLVNTRAHPLDMALQRLCGLVPAHALGLLQPAGAQVDWAPLLLVVIGTAWGYFVHANVNWRLGRLEGLLSTPRFHHWHHAHGQADAIDKNFAALLPGLDRLFGTLHLPPGQWPAGYGTDTPVPPTLLGQLIGPLKPPRQQT